MTLCRFVSSYSLALAAMGWLCACGGDATGSTPGAADSGTDAMHEAGGDAVSGDATPPPPGCPATGFVPEAAVARATAAFSSICMGVPDDGFFRTQTHLRGTYGGWAYAGDQAFVECLSQVTTGCEGVRGCQGFGWKSDSDTCDTCDGDTAILCSDGLLVRWDCTKYGGTCQGGLCSFPDEPLCDESTYTSTCDSEGRPTYCETVLHTGLSCPALGLTCDATGMGRAACAGTGAPCAGEDSEYFSVDPRGTACQGDVIHTCQRGKSATLPCPCFGEGFSCQSVAGGAFCGTASECDPETFEKTCNGTSVVFCSGGKITTIDCVELGFAECAPENKYSCQTPCSVGSECPSGHCYVGYCA